MGISVLLSKKWHISPTNNMNVNNTGNMHSLYAVVLIIMTD